MILQRKKPQTFHNVFLSYAVPDKAVADVVKHRLREAGLTVFDHGSFEDGADLAEAVREAMWESAALVAIVSPTSVESSNLQLEVGAAWGLHKPIYLLVDSKSAKEVPGYLKKFRVWPLSQVNKLTSELVELAQPFPTENRHILAEVYQQTNVPTDQLLIDPAAADQLTKAFNARCKTKLAPETLLRELLRMRKAGQLPRLKKNPRAGN